MCGALNVERSPKLIASGAHLILTTPLLLAIRHSLYSYSPEILLTSRRLAALLLSGKEPIKLSRKGVQPHPRRLAVHSQEELSRHILIFTRNIRSRRRLLQLQQDPTQRSLVSLRL